MEQSADICYLNTPVGWLELSASEKGLRSIRFMEKQPVSTPAVANPHLKSAYKQLAEYFRGERVRFELDLHPDGTDFQLDVWQRLKEIPFGTTISYGELAKAVGNPKGARAIGMANNRNPLPIVVPCHRVVGADGSMTGYAPGLEIKRRLLSLEGVES